MKDVRVQRVALSLFVALVLVVLAACGGGSQSDSSSVSSSSSSSEREEDKGKDEDEDTADQDEDEDEDTADQDEDDEDEDEDDEETGSSEDEQDEDENEDDQNETGAFDGDLEGSYIVNGVNPDDSEYQGTLEIEETGDTYQFVWEVGDTYVGTGIVVGDWLTIASGEEGVCGVAAYEVQRNGALDGLWAIQGTEDLGTEEATPADDEAEEDVAGMYDVVGTNPDGSQYEGTLEIEETGDTYQFTWEAGNDFVGTGILQDDILGVVYGDEDICGLNVYEIGSDGSLDGLWTVQGAETVAEEEAIPGEIADTDTSEAEDEDEDEQSEDDAADEDTADVEIDNIVLARDDGSGDPGDEVSVFTTDDFRLHFIINLEQMVQGIEATFVMRYVDEDVEIGELDFEWDEPLDYITAYFEPTGVEAWPAGTYELDIYLNDEFYRTVEYDVLSVTDDTSDQPAEPEEPAEPEQAEEPAGDADTGNINYETITDDTITLQVEVPTDWTDRSTNRWVISEEDVGVAMRVSPDIDAYLETWETPGLFFGASRVLVEQGVDPQTFMDSLTLDACTFVETVEYEDNLYTGLYGIWEQCGGTDTEIHEIFFMPEDGSFLGQIEIQVVTEADKAAVENIVNSFQVIGRIE